MKTRPDTNTKNTLYLCYKLASYAVPMSASNLVNMLATFVGILFVAKLGKVELAASSLAFISYIAVSTIALTSLFSISILVSHQKGQAKQLSKIGSVFKNGIWASLILGIPVSILIANLDKLLFLFGQDPQLIHITQGYFYFGALGLIPILIVGVAGQFHTGIGKPRFSLIMGLLRLPFVISLSYALVLGKFGLPQLGLAGVSCAMFLVQLVFCVFILVYISMAKHLRPYKLFDDFFKIDWSLCKKILSIGFPIGVQFGGELSAITVANYFMGYFGVMALAASQIVSQGMIIFIAINLGFSQALAVLVSEAFAKKDLILVKRYMNAAMLSLFIIVALILSVLLLNPNVLIHFYIDTSKASNVALIQLTIHLLYIAALYLLIDGLRNLLSGALRGLHDSQTAMRVGVICLWFLSVPLSYAFGFWLAGGPVALRFGFLLGVAIATVFLWVTFQRKTNLAMQSMVQETHKLNAI